MDGDGDGDCLAACLQEIKSVNFHLSGLDVVFVLSCFFFCTNKLNNKILDMVHCVQATKIDTKKHINEAVSTPLKIIFDDASAVCDLHKHARDHIKPSETGH